MTISSNIAPSAQAAEAPSCFADLNLHPKLLTAVTNLGFVTPTAIQRDAIPVVLTGSDVIGVAQTGTGKTLAFGLPILNRFLKANGRCSGRSLIILPTRELAIQVEETLHKIGKTFGLRTAILIGGAPMRPQQSSLRANPDVIVATPGRLIDHLQTHALDLRTVDTLVLDEADRMLDMGFEPQIKQILRAVPVERQTLLFSATMPPKIVDIAKKYMYEPTRVEVAQQGTTVKAISQELYVVPQENKNDLLADLLYDYKGTVLVFARTRSRAARIARFVKKADHTAAEIHSDRSLLQRRAALDGFKSGKYRVLVATDIAARGIDVSDIELVVNYDLPDNAEDYVHRIGRTGRAGKSGHAISFAAPDQASDVRDIERLIRINVDVSKKSKHQFDARAGSSSSSKRRPSGARPGNKSGFGGGGHYNSKSSKPGGAVPSGSHTKPRTRTATGNRFAKQKSSSNR
jgi:ATP-dependent RNA helicase RhlE